MEGEAERRKRASEQWNESGTRTEKREKPLFHIKGGRGEGKKRGRERERKKAQRVKPRFPSHRKK